MPGAGVRGRTRRAVPGDISRRGGWYDLESRAAEDVPEIIELDLNPVIVLPRGEGCRIVDVRVRVGPPPIRPARRVGENV